MTTLLAHRSMTMTGHPRSRVTRTLASPGLLAVALAAAAAATAACGGQSTTAGVIPTLPGDGTEHVAGLGEPSKPTEQPHEPDPWEGREDLIRPPAPAAPAPVTLPKTTRFKLRSGLEVIVVESPRVPVVSMQLAIKVGRADSERDKVGVDQFVAEMLTKGTKTRTAPAIAQMIDNVGGSIDASSTFEATWVSCSALSKSLRTCLTLLPDVVMNPTFPAAEMDQVRDRLRAQVLQTRDNAGLLATVHFQNLMWGDDHVRGWPLSLRTIDAIKRADLIAWHKTWFRPNNAILAIAGNVKASQIKAELDRAFWFWQSGTLPERPSYDEPELRGSVLRLVDKPGQTQAHVRIGHLGIAHTDPRFYAAQVFNYSLGGGGFASRLMKVVRSEGGKSYGASSAFDRSLDRGAFMASTFTRSAEAATTIGLMLTEIAKMRQAGPTEDEVAAAIANLAGGYGRRLESSSDVAGALLAADLHGFNEGYVTNYPLAIAGVTPGEAREAAAALLDPQNVAVVVVGDAAALEPQFTKAGWKYDKIGYTQPVAGYERQLRAAEPADPSLAAAGIVVLDQALAAKGGEKALRALRSFTIEAEGQIKSGGRQIPAVVSRTFLAPDKVRLDIVLAGGAAKIVTALEGNKGWGIQPQQGVSELPAQAVTELRKQLWRDQEFVLLRHKDPGTVVKSLGTKTIGDRQVHVVELTRADGAVATTLLIDAKTFLLAGMAYTDQGLDTTESYADYRQVSGIQVAHTRQTVNAQAELIATIKKIQLNAPVDPAVFKKPAN